jgi:hypothetical protein
MLMIQGSKIANVRPYRLSQYETIHMGYHVSLLLECGVIERSSSAFNSPALMVLKTNPRQYLQESEIPEAASITNSLSAIKELVLKKTAGDTSHMKGLWLDKVRFKKLYPSHKQRCECKNKQVCECQVKKKEEENKSKEPATKPDIPADAGEIAELPNGGTTDSPVTSPKQKQEEEAATNTATDEMVGPVDKPSTRSAEGAAESDEIAEDTGSNVKGLNQSPQASHRLGY